MVTTGTVLLAGQPAIGDLITGRSFIRIPYRYQIGSKIPINHFFSGYWDSFSRRNSFWARRWQLVSFNTEVKISCS
jgi:hypothetical protein